MLRVLVSLCILPLRAHPHMSPNILRYTGYSATRAKRDTRVKKEQTVSSSSHSPFNLLFQFRQLDSRAIIHSWFLSNLLFYGISGCLDFRIHESSDFVISLQSIKNNLIQKCYLFYVKNLPLTKLYKLEILKFLNVK